MIVNITEIKTSTFTHSMMAPCGRKPVSYFCQSRKHQFLYGILQSPISITSRR